MAHSKKAQFCRFAAVGAVGFLVDLGVLLVLVRGIGAHPYLARPISVLAAMLFTWAVNRTFTFSIERTTSLMRELLLYITVSLGGSIINYLVYCAVYWIIGVNFPLALAVSVAAGSLAGLVWNFSASRRLVFKQGGATKPISRPGLFPSDS
jgi:putative flippase GtrA